MTEIKLTPNRAQQDVTGVAETTMVTATDVPAVAASLETDTGSADTDLVYTAKAAGAAGNGIAVEYVDPAGNDEPLAVSVNDGVITVSLETDSGGALISTATDVAAGIVGSVPANALVTVSNADGSTGAGVAPIMALQGLTGGLDGSYVATDGLAIEATLGLAVHVTNGDMSDLVVTIAAAGAESNGVDRDITIAAGATTVINLVDQARYVDPADKCVHMTVAGGTANMVIKAISL